MVFNDIVRFRLLVEQDEASGIPALVLLHWADKHNHVLALLKDFPGTELQLGRSDEVGAELVVLDRESF